jgi:hypothetical protein
MPAYAKDGQAVRGFYSRAFVESVTLLAAGYNYGGN